MSTTGSAATPMAAISGPVPGRCPRVLIIAVAAAIIDMVIGMSYGLISGYFGGKVDMMMQRFLEVANGIPRLVIVTLLLLVLKPGMITIIFALMLTEWWA